MFLKCTPLMTIECSDTKLWPILWVHSNAPTLKGKANKWAGIDKKNHTIYLFICFFVYFLNIFLCCYIGFCKIFHIFLVLVFVAPFSQPCIDIVGWWTPQKEPELTQFTHQLIFQLLPTLGIITYPYLSCCVFVCKFSWTGDHYCFVFCI
jgi:hypothetical protein